MYKYSFKHYEDKPNNNFRWKFKILSKKIQQMHSIFCRVIFKTAGTTVSFNATIAI